MSIPQGAATSESKHLQPGRRLNGQGQQFLPAERWCDGGCGRDGSEPAGSAQQAAGDHHSVHFRRPVVDTKCSGLGVEVGQRQVI